MGRPRHGAQRGVAEGALKRGAFGWPRVGVEGLEAGALGQRAVGDVHLGHRVGQRREGDAGTSEACAFRAPSSNKPCHPSRRLD